jgi:alanine racemase
VSKPIVLMEGLFYPDEMAEAEKHRFTLVVHRESHVEWLEKATVKTPFPVWLKINTGMHRLGMMTEQLPLFYRRLSKASSVKQPMGLMSHFAEADNKSSSATSNQMQLFKQVIANVDGPQSLANSAGIIAWPDAHKDWVRPGLMLYGASPFSENTGLDHGLMPVMTLSSRLIAITPVKRGGKIGYGGTWTAPEDMMIGVVGVGYGDGYPQFAQNGTPILVNGQECALVGKVSMDMLTVDLRSQPQAQVGDEVILWGRGLPVERVAKNSNTSPYEILTRMTPRPKIEVLT